LPRRASKPPWAFADGPWPHTAAVDRIDVVRVGTLPKIGWMSSYGARKLPILNVPQPPCRPTKVSRPASVPPPASPLIDDSIWKIAFRPPPRDSVPRTPRRDEFELTRYRFGFVPSEIRV
jgi:hypothetical protein